MYRFLYSLSIFIFSLTAFSQSVEVLNIDKKESFRGLSVVNQQTLWVSGTHGTVGKSTDGGNTFHWMTVKGFEQTDFRDIEAFDEHTAIIMGIAEPAYLLKTTDGGANWKIVYENHQKGMFLDAIDFKNRKNGVVIGDPIAKKMFLATTRDAGDTWQVSDSHTFPAVEMGEACFASSGTNIMAMQNEQLVFVTGGIRSRLYKDHRFKDLPILQGKESTGANSIAMKNSKTIVVVGGDFMEKDLTNQNCVLSYDGGKTFLSPEKPPNGYRSCVIFWQQNKWITCGLNGVDISTDEGKTWQSISHEGFHVCKKAKNGKAVYFAGNGKIGKLIEK